MSVHTMTADPTQADIRAAAGVNDTMLAIGRILIALIFVSSGIEKFMDLGATASAMPLPMVAATLSWKITMAMKLSYDKALVDWCLL
jgi:uncharacterized membrane protein YphA (DoxX/SURF4 family)